MKTFWLRLAVQLSLLVVGCTAFTTIAVEILTPLQILNNDQAWLITALSVVLLTSYFTWRNWPGIKAAAWAVEVDEPNLAAPDPRYPAGDVIDDQLDLLFVWVAIPLVVSGLCWVGPYWFGASSSTINNTAAISLGCTWLGLCLLSRVWGFILSPSR